MKKIDNYILEKLHISKDYKILSIKEEIDNILNECKESLKNLSWTYNEDIPGELHILFPKEFVMFFPRLKGIFEERLTYKINKINWTLSSGLFNIYYEEDK